MPIPNDYTPIIEQLLGKTREGKVRWRKGRFDTFSVQVGDTSFEIWAGTSEDTGIDFVSFGLADPSAKSQRIIDSWSVDQGEKGYEAMHQLYSDARRHALGIPKRLDALENALKNSDVIGEDDEDDIPF